MGYRNNVFFGLALGIVVPLIGYVFWNSFFSVLMSAELLSSEEYAIANRERTIALLAICMNIIPLQVYSKRRCDQTIRGLTLPIVVLIGVWIYFYMGNILENFG